MDLILKIKERKKIILLTLLISAVLLTVFILQKTTNPFSKANISSNIEAESGSLSGGASIQSDNSASGNKYIKLTSGSGIDGTSYYIDCSSGDDLKDGKSPDTAWKNLSKINSLQLEPGDGVFLKRSTTCSDSIVLSKSGTRINPITLGAYGSGELPIIQSSTNNTRIINIQGSYIAIENIYTKGIALSTESGCDNNPKGYIVGFQLDDSSHHITLKNNKATGNYAGIYIKSGSNNNKILYNTIENNTMMNPLDKGGDGDAGAFGVLIHGSDNEIAYNLFRGHDACSYDYDRDGSDVEIYGGSRNIIHHNKGSESDHFSELGKNSTQSSNDNIYSYNTFTSSLKDTVFLNTRGEGHTYGPIYNTKVYNNSVYLTGSESQGVVCSNCGSDILTLRNNILWAQWKSIYASTSFTESNNIYWKTGGNPFIQGFTISSTSKTVDPHYVNAPGGNLHIQSSSPAVNSGSNESVTAGFTTDLDNNPVPNGSAPDIGAFEI